MKYKPTNMAKNTTTAGRISLNDDNGYYDENLMIKITIRSNNKQKIGKYGGIERKVGSTDKSSSEMNEKLKVMLIP